MSFSVYIIPVIFLILAVFARFKGVNVYDAFVGGAKEAVPLVVSLFPYLAAIFVLTELFEASGLSGFLQRILTPVWGFLGIPSDLGELILIKPFSGSGSLAVLSDFYSKYGADGYLSRCASVIYGSSETVFYVSAVYFSGAKNAKLLLPVIISLLAGVLSAVIACRLCAVI